MDGREASAKRTAESYKLLRPAIEKMHDRIHEILPPDDRAVVAMLVAAQFFNQAAQYQQQRSEELAAMPLHLVALNLAILHCVPTADEGNL